MANGINAIGASKTTDTTFGETSHINQTDQNFDWVGKLDAINATQTSLLHNVQNLQKKRVVEEAGVFSANMDGKTSLGSKVKQLFENIKLKFWDVSKSISKDCNKLEHVLTGGVADVIRGANDKFTMEAIFEIIGEKIDKLLSDKAKVSMYKNEEDSATIEEHLEDVSELKNRIETLKGFLTHADNLNKFSAFYKEPTRDDIEYARETAKLHNRQFNEEDELCKMQPWQQGQFGDLKSAKAFLNENKEHPLKSLLNEKIVQTEDRVLDGNRIRQFYEDFGNGKINSEKLASRCNALVKHLKSIEKWLSNAEPPHPVIKENTFSERIWKENLMYELDPPTAKKISGTEKNSENDSIDKQLEVYLSKHKNQDIKLNHYRGIPYIADRNGNPVSIE